MAEIFEASGVEFDKSRDVTDMLLDAIINPNLSKTDLQAIIQRNGIESADIAKMFGVNIGENLDFVNKIKKADRIAAALRLRSLKGDEVGEEAARRFDDLQSADTVRNEKLTDFWTKGNNAYRRATDIWRSALVSQIVTATRNALSTGARGGWQVLTDVVDASTQSVLGGKGDLGTPWNAVGNELRFLFKPIAQAAIRGDAAALRSNKALEGS